VTLDSDSLVAKAIAALVVALLVSIAAGVVAITAFVLVAGRSRRSTG